MREILDSVNSVGDVISLGTVITIEGILVVFAILILIMLTIYAMGLFSGATPKKEKKPTQNSLAIPVEESVSEAVDDIIDDNELIAVLTAAVAVCMGTSSSSVNIKSYKKISSAWSNAAKREVLDNKF